jgi:hypothetical protein
MEKIMKVFVAMLFGVILAPIIYTLAVNANVAGTTATVLAIVPVVFVLVVLVASFKGLTSGI